MQQRQQQIHTDTQGHPVMSLHNIRLLCAKEQLADRPQQNEKLYLYERGFGRIKGLEQFVNLVALWLNNNNITRIENLESLVNLVSLDLHRNAIVKMEGLGTLKHLQILNLEDNKIAAIEGVENLSSLKNLNLAQNLLRTKESIAGISLLPYLSVLNLAKNEVQESEQVFELIISLKSITCLELKATPFARGYKNYRKKLIAQLSNLKFLDERPVQETDHRLCEAWLKGGNDQQKKQRERLKIEQKTKQLEKRQKADKQFLQLQPKIDKTQQNNKTEASKQSKAKIVSTSPSHSGENNEQQHDIQSGQDMESDKQPQIKQPANIDKWLAQYNPLLQTLLQRHRFDFYEVQPQLNMILANVNKRLDRPIVRFQVEQLLKIWARVEIQKREGQNHQ